MKKQEAYGGVFRRGAGFLLFVCLAVFTLLAVLLLLGNMGDFDAGESLISADTEEGKVYFFGEELYFGKEFLSAVGKYPGASLEFTGRLLPVTVKNTAERLGSVLSQGFAVLFSEIYGFFTGGI